MGLISLSAKIKAFLYFGLNQNLDQTSLLKFLIIQMKCTTVIQCVKTFIFDVL